MSTQHIFINLASTIKLMSKLGIVFISTDWHNTENVFNNSMGVSSISIKATIYKIEVATLTLFDSDGGGTPNSLS